MPPLPRVSLSPVRRNNGVQIHHDLVSDLDRILTGPPCIRDGNITQEQAAIGADLSWLQDDYSEMIGDLATQVANWQRGVTRDYTVAALAPTLADVATITIPAYPTPAPYYANWVLVPLGPDAGIYDRTTGAAVPLDGFPVGTQVTVDTISDDGASGVFQIKAAPATGAAPQFEPFIRFTPYNRRLAIQLDADQHTFFLNAGARFSQIGDILLFSPETEAEITGLHDTDAALTTESARQQGELDTHTGQISGLTTRTNTLESRQNADDTLNQQQNSRLTTNEAGIAQEREINLAQAGTLDTHTGQISSLQTRATQLEGRADQNDTLDGQQNTRLASIENQLPTFDTPQLRDAAIAQELQEFHATNSPEIALITDPRIQQNYNPTTDETVFTFTGMPLGSQIAGIWDPQGYEAQILKPRRLNGGTVLNFAIKGNTPLAASADTAWKVCISVHVPINFVASTANPATAQPTL